MENNRKLVAVDPGPNCGISLWAGTELEDGKVFSSLPEMYFQLSQVLTPSQVDLVIVEDFVGPAYTEPEKVTIGIIGFIEGLCAIRNIPMQKQAPAVRRGYIQFAKIYVEAIDLSSDVKRHCKDSIAHALRYFHKVEKTWSPSLK